ncbi:S1C family serine protease [Paenibacillus sp. J22TS3]|uniref:S1C family serine protease n=1 Tax=Paenibacillus sp. J22TS3 TaxID=2807192 RepID=UPI001B19A67D|nr:trypsin-like peptidase domain-containing protein [Paenibacillus sp. J22TS3]GIP21702.1 serine protease Do-like HtrB [Paenibacillus sp. J22TS3]
MELKGKVAAGLLFGVVLGLGSGIAVPAGASSSPLTSKGISSKVKADSIQTVKAKSNPNSKSSSSANSKASSNSARATVTTQVDPVPQIIQKVSPSVVGIIGKASEQANKSQGDSRYDLAHGTGVIIRSDGWIVTNTHVVQGLTNALVVTADGKSYSIVESYVDEVSDIALIKINAKSLHPAKFAPASRSTVVGEKVIALGTPISFSLRNSATQGIVSGVNRAVNAAYRLIQTDTAINPGNSGGPLLNMKGEVIGINSMKFEAIGVENMGFSIPVNTVQYVVDQLFEYGTVNRPSLGVELEESWSAVVGLPGDEPMTVKNVHSAEAQKAGLQKGDVLYRLDGRKVSSVVDLNELLKSYSPGQTVTLWLESGGDIVTRKLVLSKDSGSLSGAGTSEKGEDQSIDDQE